MHVDKYNKKQTVCLLGHYARTHAEYKNKTIDKGKTHLNYNLCQHDNEKNFIENRLKEVKIQKRADVNIMCDWVITLPKDIKNEAQEKQFFEKSYEFFEQKYGKENTISAWIHKDETQPHMHFCFIPVVWETKKERYKVCAKELITRKALQKIHAEMQSYLDKNLNFKAKILNENPTQSYKKVEELKLEKELNDIKKLNENLQKRELTTTAALIKQDKTLVDFFARAMQLVKSNKIVSKNKEKSISR